MIYPRVAAPWLHCSPTQALTELRALVHDFDGDRIILMLGDDSHWAVIDYQMFDIGAEVTYIALTASVIVSM